MNQDILVDIINIGANGEGVAKYDGRTVFIPYTCVGEKVSAKVTHANKNVAFATLTKLITPSDDRVLPECKLFGKCGGCQLQHINYNQQLIIKANSVVNTFRKVGNIDIDMPTVVPSPCQYHYRNKLVLPIVQGDNGIEMGFFAQGTHKVIPLSSCPLHGQWATDVIDVVRQFANQYGISGYDECSGKGVLRHLVVRKTNNISVTLVINSDQLPHSQQLLAMLTERVGECNLYLSINTKRNNVVLGEKCIMVGGTPSTVDILGYNFNVSPYSFLQVNDAVRDYMYSTVRQLSEGSAITLIDAYSGVGATSCLLASGYSHVYGIEIVKQATIDADCLASKYGLSHKITNLNGDCRMLLPQLLERLVGSDDVSRPTAQPNATIIDSIDSMNSCNSQDNVAQSIDCIVARGSSVTGNTTCINNDDLIKHSALDRPNTIEHSVNTDSSGSSHTQANSCIVVNTHEQLGDQGSTEDGQCQCNLLSADSNNTISSGRADHITVLLDPPRKGCDKEIIDSLCRYKPSRIIYISCNPSTLARDIAPLLNDYTISTLQLFDLFPQTSHIETLVSLIKKS